MTYLSFYNHPPSTRARVVGRLKRSYGRRIGFLGVEWVRESTIRQAGVEDEVRESLDCFVRGVGGKAE